MSSEGISTSGCRVFIHVADLEKAIRFYRDLLGHPVERAAAKWADLAPPGGVTLTVEDEGPIEFHADDLEAAADRLEQSVVPSPHEEDRFGPPPFPLSSRALQIRPDPFEPCFRLALSECAHGSPPRHD